MSVELLQTLSIASFIAAGVFFLGAVILFFVLDVPKLIGDISGATARNAIEAIRQQNEKTGNKAYKPSRVNAARGKITDKISPSGKIKPDSSGLGISAQTEKLDTTELTAAAVEATTLLNAAAETSVLKSDDASVTTILSDINNPTEINPVLFSIDFEISYTSSMEIIE